MSYRKGRGNDMRIRDIDHAENMPRLERMPRRKERIER